MLKIELSLPKKTKLSSKRAVEKDSILQLSIAKSLETSKKLEILCMEVRLNKRQKIKQLLQILNIKSDLSLKSLFKPAIAKKILLYYLGQLERKRSALIDYRAPSDKSLHIALIFNNPELGPRQIFQLFGLRKALEMITMRELRVMFAKCSKRSWYRLMADVNKVKMPANISFVFLYDCLLKFKLLKMAQFFK